MTEAIQSLDLKGIDDNARKFTSGAIDEDFLKGHNAISYTLITDWIVTRDGNEEKVVAKTLGGGETQYLSITKAIRDGKRTTDKKMITKDEYENLRVKPAAHSEKRRSDFTYTQNGISFALKYDEFLNGGLMLEVDALNNSEEDRKKFDISSFPTKLVEVTGDAQYYGYRIAEITSPKTR